MPDQGQRFGCDLAHPTKCWMAINVRDAQNASFHTTYICSIFLPLGLCTLCFGGECALDQALTLQHRIEPMYI